MGSSFQTGRARMAPCIRANAGPDSMIRRGTVAAIARLRAKEDEMISRCLV